MPRNIVICEDEPEYTIQVMECLKRCGRELGEELRIQNFSSGEALLDRWPPETQVLILDIRMGDISGMDAARELRRRGVGIPIIFLTSLAQYALEGYDVRAFSFLLKPVEYASLRDRLRSAFRLLDEERGEVLRLKNAGGISIIPVNSIDYAESQRHTAILVHGGTRESFQLPMKELEQALEGKGFFRCHKGYLVNLRRIRRIEAEMLLMENGDRVPLSRHRRTEFLDAFEQCMGERIYG